MDEQGFLAVRFEEQRRHLEAVAYRMLGSLSEADDAVQDAWERLSRSDADKIENLGGWLTTVVARVCLNKLRARGVRREEPLESHVPDPVVRASGDLAPDEEAILADSVGLALLVVLDTLTPAERLAFVLHDMFDLPFEEIAPMVGRSPPAARQLASRARRRVKGAEAQEPAHDFARQKEVVDAFFCGGTRRRLRRVGRVPRPRRRLANRRQSRSACRVLGAPRCDPRGATGTERADVVARSPGHATPHRPGERSARSGRHHGRRTHRRHGVHGCGRQDRRDRLDRRPPTGPTLRRSSAEGLKPSVRGLPGRCRLPDCRNGCPPRGRHL